MKLLLSAVLCVAVFGAVVQGQCAKGINGTLPVSGSCDAYIECKNGLAEEKLCPDGLFYNEYSNGYPCSYPIDVECSSGRVQPAQPGKDCPHQFGYFRIGDSSHCGQFVNCDGGRAFIFDCPDGLAWSKDTYRCDWPDQVPDCDAEKFLGFKCPAPPAKSSIFGVQEAEYHFYPSAENCQVYFICVEGRPRRIWCGADQAFNPETQVCDDIENVNTCNAEIKAKGIEIKNARLAAAQNKIRPVNKFRV